MNRIKAYISTAILLMILVIAITTNPTKKEFTQYSERLIGEPPEENVEREIEHINFFVFSTFTPMVFDEYGTTHLGIFGQFIQISEGQFDYPAWLELFN